MTSKTIALHFDHVFAGVMKMHKYVSTMNVDQDKVKSMIAECIKAAQNFKNKLPKNFDVNELIDSRKGEMFKINDILVGKNRDIFIHAGHHNDCRKCNDILFGALGIKQPKKRFAHLPTDLCQEFCKGITYFSYDEPFEESPFYHRSDSCGTSTKTAKEKFKSNTTREYVKRCYLERLIYDAIYTNTFHSQDIEHMHELDTMARLYQKFFQGASINVHLSYTSFIYPHQLIVYYMDKDGTVIETYTKTRRAKFVKCQREFKGQKYDKVQSYNQESPWLLNAATGGAIHIVHSDSR